ncbi:ABC transporter substrate-binding protein [Streptomyces sp. YIM 98790]|uniref:ABC transporter substrate-binding protein n=1 Tax=Streptomyces sp. YIM 98790 TaxID=2689077 RepID=UPI00140B8443|nr:ABC transporter substrate-binding protein [Streptomyces sp. YIM 98790]
MAHGHTRSFLRRTAAATVAGGIALTMAQAGSAGAEAPGAKERKDTLVVGKVGLNDIPHLNPLDSGWVIQGEINNLMYDPLIQWGQEDYAPTAALAERWEHSEDGLTWTYYIDPDATWSDGEPVTAQDATFTFELLQNNEVFHERHGSLVDNMASIEAVDDKTLVITVEEPSALMNHLNNTMIMPEHVWSGIENPEEYLGEPGQPTSGAFRLTEYSPGERVVLTANENYWAGPVAYDELVFQSYETTEAAVQALISGEIDLLDQLNPEQTAALEAEDGISVNIQPSRHWDSIGFNVGARTRDGTPMGDGHPALTDPAVRRAIHHVVDKERLIEVIHGGNATPGVSIVPPIFTAHFWDPGEETVEVSAELGNQLLDEAGYTERNGDGLRVDPESGEPLSFRLYYHSDRPSYADIQDFLVDWVAGLGIELRPEAMETTPLNEQVEAGNFDIAFGNWNYGPDPDEDFAYHTCDRLPAEPEPTDLTFSFYCNEEFDALFRQQKQEPDLDARAGAVRQMQQILYRDTPQIIFFYDFAMEAYSDEWTGFGMMPASGGSISRQQAAYGYEQATPVAAAEDGEGGEAAGDSDDDGGPGAGLVIAGLVAVLLVAGAVVWTLRRRRTADDRE